MLEFNVPWQLEDQATELICQNAVRFLPNNRAKILEGIMDEFKDGEIAPKMTAYVVKFNEDGTTTVLPRDTNNGNEHLLASILSEEGQTLMIRNEQGKTICLAPFQVNDKSYLRTFTPEEAPSIRETLSAKLEPPKEPSFYDKVCNFFATRFLKRPGKAVKAYNEKKAYYAAMQKGLETLTGIPQKVEDYKQAKIEEQKRIEQEALKKQQELLKQKEQEEALLKEIEEQKKQEALRIKQQRAEEEKQFQALLKKQKLQEALTKQQPKEVDDAQLKQLQELYEKLPKQVSEKMNLAENKKRLSDDLQKDEKNFNTVKEAYEKEKRLVEQTQADLANTRTELKQANADIKKMDQQKILSDKKAAATANLNKASKDVTRYKKELEQEKLVLAQCKEEYDAVKGDSFINSLKPEEYIQHQYVKNSEARKRAYEKTREMTLVQEMNEVQRELELRKGQKEKVDEASSVWDRAPLIGGWRTKGKALKDLDEKVEELEKRYADLQKKDEENLKTFQAEEEKYMAIERNFSPENLKLAEDFLNASREKGRVKREAYKASETRRDHLAELIKQGNKAITAAQKELDAVAKDPLSADKYDANQHQQLMNRVPGLENKIEDLTLSLKDLNPRLKERALLVKNAEIKLQEKKTTIATVDAAYQRASDEVAKSQMAITHHTSLLQKRGLEVPPPPENVRPHLQFAAPLPQVQAKRKSGPA